MDVAEDDVAHRRAGRDGDGQREERDQPFRVDAPVDRVDDDPPRGALPEDALAELLGHEHEVDAGCVKRLEAPLHGTLGRDVDRDRVVAALAATGGLLALGARRELGERVVDVAGDLPAEGQPWAPGAGRDGGVTAHSSNGEKSRPLASFG